MTSVDTVDSFAEFDSLRKPWNELARQSGSTVPYDRHEWLASCWLGFGERARLHVLVAREGSALVAAAPLMASRRTLAGLPIRALHGIGLNAGFSDFLAAPGRQDALRAVIERALAWGEYDVLLVRGTTPGGRKEAGIRECLERAGARYETSACEECYLDAQGGLDGYRAGRATKFWANVRNRTKRLHQRGAVTYDRVREPDRFPSALGEAFDVSLRSWKGREGTAVGLKPTFRSFLAELMSRFGARGEAELWLLRVEGRAIAFRLGVRERDTFLECEVAFDDAYRPFSPGTLLGAHSNEVLIREGVGEINLGMAFPWKEEWAPRRRTRVEWIAYRRRSVYAGLLRGARALRRRLARGRGARAGGERGGGRS